VETKEQRIEKIIKIQCQKWEAMRKDKEKDKKRKGPAITISRLPGSGAEMIAQHVAEELGFDYYDNNIVEKVAENSKLSAALIRTLDEKRKSMVADWLLYLVSDRYLWREEFLRKLAEIFATLGKHGQAVILGRGAGFIIPPKEALRVLIVAPLEARVRKVMKDLSLSKEEAKKRIDMIDSERKGYVRQFFQVDMMDPLHYDLVVNTDPLSIDGAVNLIKLAWNEKRG
jgi:cytidylate kinase